MLGRALRSREAAAAGVTPSRQRRDDVGHPHHGVRTFGVDGGSVLGRARAFAPALLPGQFFSHATALALHDVELPPEHAERVHVSVEFPRTPPRGRGIHGHSLRRLLPSQRFGLPVTTAETAWCHAAAVLSRAELVMAGDRLVTGVRVRGARADAETDLERLAAEHLRQLGGPGSARRAWALERIRSGVDSRMETRLRLLLVEHGLPEPVVDHAVPTIERMLHVDLAYPDRRVAIEYEGDVHRTDQMRFRRDITRREQLEAAGWRVIRVTVADLADPRALVGRIRRVLAQRR